ncbi:MAG: hypothetical protein QXK72_00915 [Candidatus Bathyarchaeia archaeon]|nr:hypothetical protein [Candidatus Bathyarchaeota archaeon]
MTVIDETRKFDWGGEVFEGRFKEGLLEAIDDGLLVLGEIARQALYSHIERRYQVKRDEIPNRLEVLHETLESVFGAASTRVIERLIVKTLCSRIGSEFIEHENWTLLEYVEDLRKRLGL